MKGNNLKKLQLILSVTVSALVLVGMITGFSVKIAMVERTVNETADKVEKLEQTNSDLIRKMDLVNYRLDLLDKQFSKIEDQLDALLKKVSPGYEYQPETSVVPDSILLGSRILPDSVRLLGGVNLSVLKTDSLLVKGQRIEEKFGVVSEAFNGK